MKKWLNNTYVCWAITIITIMVCSILLFFGLFRAASILRLIKDIFRILLPFVYGLAIAYLLNIMVRFFEEKFIKNLVKKFIKNENKRFRVTRIISIFLAALILISFIALLFWIIIPQILSSFDVFASNISDYFKTLKQWLSHSLANKPKLRGIIMENYDNITKDVVSYINDTMMPERKNLISNISNGFLSLVKTITNLILGFIISIYVIYNKELFSAQIKKILYSIFSIEKVNMIIKNTKYMDKVFNGFFVGKIIDSVIIGLICYIFMVIFKMPFPLIIALIVGITNIIPYFGPFIGAIPSGFLILVISPTKCLIFLIFIFILQQFDGNILGPKILGQKTGLKSIWVLFAIILFGGLFGFVGMIIGVPLFSILYAFISAMVNRQLDRKDLSTKTDDYVNLKEIGSKNKKMKYEKGC